MKFSEIRNKSTQRDCIQIISPISPENENRTNRESSVIFGFLLYKEFTDCSIVNWEMILTGTFRHIPEKGESRRRKNRMKTVTKIFFIFLWCSQLHYDFSSERINKCLSFNHRKPIFLLSTEVRAKVTRKKFSLLSRKHQKRIQWTCEQFLLPFFSSLRWSCRQRAPKFLQVWVNLDQLLSFHWPDDNERVSARPKFDKLAPNVMFRKTHQLRDFVTLIAHGRLESLLIEVEIICVMII